MKFTWKNKTVLLVEDDEASCVYLSELLKVNMVEVIKCNNGLTAFFHSMNNPWIDLVIMDMKLPEMNGFEATRLIKKYQPSLPVLAVTACAMLEDKRRCKIAGCDAYLSKPVLPEEFLSTVNQFLKIDRRKPHYSVFFNT